jgi:hypothetical protein
LTTLIVIKIFGRIAELDALSEELEPVALQYRPKTDLEIICFTFLNLSLGKTRSIRKFWSESSFLLGKR